MNGNAIRFGAAAAWRTWGLGLGLAAALWGAPRAARADLAEGFETGMPTAYSTGNYTLGSGSWSFVNVIRGTTKYAGSYSCQIRSSTGAEARTPALTGGVGTISFWVYSSTSTGGLQVNLSSDGGSTWTPASGSPFTGLGAAWVQKQIVVDDSGVNKVQFLRTAATIYLDEVSITASAAATPPTFTSGTGPYGATSGVATAFTVTASGSPAPTLALQSTTASSGYSFTAGTGQLSYTPPQADGGGTRTFTFTASNSAGVATQTVSVAVTAGTAPAFTSGAAFGATSGVAMAFTVAASGTPSPTLALQSETAAGTVNFTPGTGALNYTPDAGDVGIQTFTFTASNVAGVATQAVSVTVANVAVAPAFTSGAAYGATSLVAMAFTVAASGNPAPTLALQSEDAAGSVAFTAGTGVLDYTPATNDVGNRSFTFTASNSAGVATQTVTVAVAAAPTAIPTVSVVNALTNGFTIQWTACTDATNYQVQVATDTNFVAGSSSEALTEDFAALTDTAVPSGWTSSKTSDLDYTGEPYVGAAAPAFKFATTGQWLQSPVFATGATNLQFWAYGNGGAGSAIAVSALVNSVWTLVDTVAIAANDGTYNVPLDSQTTQLRFDFTKTVNCAFDDVVVQGVSASASLVMDRTVAALTTDATGLEMSTTYYVRARKEGGEWSAIVSATTADPAPTPPAFGANPGPVTATATLATAFAVAATGYPAPTLALAGTTASGGYAFTTGTGTLDYTPPEADVGARTFTFTASNVAGVATQVVSVTVAGAPVYVPTASVTNIGTNVFTVDWTEVTDAATYEIQIATDTNFSVATVGTNLLSESFATLTDTTVPGGWTNNKTSDLDWTTYYGLASPAYKFGTSGQWLQSPVFAAGATNLQFWGYGRLGTGTYVVSGLVSGAWTLIDTVTVARNGATYNVPLDPQTTQIKFTFIKSGSINCGLDDVVVQGGAAAGSLRVAETVAALTYDATGLDLLTAYYVRVRAAPTGTWSAIVQAITLGNDPVVPWFTAGAGPYSTTAGVSVAFTVSAMGVPAPALALAGATAAAGSYAFTPETGYFIYSPPLGDAGAQTFTFTASNTTGVATQTVAIAVAAATAPVFTGGTAYGATTLVTRVITVEAAGAPAPVLALTDSTATPDSYSFSPELGRLSYTPPTNDVGTKTFTFTASNLAGVATQTVSVVVSNMPAVGPTIDALPRQTTMVGLEFDYTVTATDPDTAASNLTFACTSAVASATWAFDTNSGYFVFIPTTNQIGTNVFSFQATDHPTSLTSPWSNLAVVVSAAGDPVSVSFGSARIVGDEGAGTLLVPVNLAYSGSASVQFRFTGPTNGTALRGVDFNCSTTLTISGASSGNLVLELANDVLPEGAESVKIALVPVSPATAGAITQTVVHLRDDDTVAIMAANITSGSNQEYEGPGNRIFQALCPDVTLVQEFNMTNGTTEAVYRSWVDQTFGTNFSYCHEPLASANIPNGIVSRWPIVEYGEWDDTTLTDRDFVWAKIDLPGDKYLYAISLHIKASSGYESQRTTETRMLTNYIAQAGWSTNDYIVIGGDFNLQVRTETALSVLTAKVVSDSHQSADQVGNKNTNSGRDNPYDLVLPSPGLDARHRTYYFGGYAYANGVVFDTRITWASGLPSPALSTDSAAVNMQHMGALKIFELERDAAVDEPLAFSAAPASSSQIDLAYTRNAVGDDVIVVWDGDGTFTAPTGTAPAVGAAFAGGTVLYKGSASPQSHTGLSACQTYYYKCWSYAGTVYSSNGLTASATTAEPAAPASIWATATNAASLGLAWSPVSGATSYLLDVCAGPSFSGGGAGWQTVFRETMGVSAGTTTLAEHEAADGFDNDAYTMDAGGADSPADVRISSASTNYVDPAGSAASAGANIYFTTTGVSGAVGYGIAGIDTRGYEALSLSFGYRKELASTNMKFSVEWSVDGGAAWNPIALSNMPAEDAAGIWYMVSNLAISAAATGSTNLSLRWVRETGAAPGRIDDVLLQGYSASSAFAPGYSNRTVSGATSLTVTGLTAGATYFFRVAAVAGCASPYSPVGSAALPAAPSFAANPGPISATVGVATAFVVAASGSPAPTLALAGTTAAGGYGFTPATGELAYTPTPSDVGVRLFTFTASNASGVATQVVSVSVADLPPVAPAFTSGAAFGATTGVARVFAVTASGYPPPALALAAATATGGYGFTPATGELAYAPPEADVGAQTFTFTASNAAGVATQTVAATVVAGLPAPPATLWASSTNQTGFTASWSAAPLATGYRLDVSTSPTFQIVDAAGTRFLLASNAAHAPAMITNGWSGLNLSQGSTNYVTMTQSTSVVTSPAFSTVGFTNLTVDFMARTFGGSTRSNITVSISTNDGADWAVLAVASPSNGSEWVAMPTLTHVANLGHGQTRIRWQSLDAGANMGVGVSNLVVMGWAPNILPSLLPGYSNLAVAGTSQTVTGLSVNATYHFRVRAVNANGAGANSAPASVTTLPKANQTVDFPALGDWLTTDVVGLLATASSGLEVSFAVASGPAVITDGILTFTNAGAVSIVASQAGNEFWNAAPNVTNTFTVTKDAAAVTLGGLSQAFDGNPKSATATTEPAGLAVEFTYDGSATAPSAVGTYVVTGTVVDAMYQGSATGTLAITNGESLTAFQLWVRDEQGQSLSDPDFAEAADSDGDGMTTYEEYLADTDPATNASLLVLTGKYFSVSSSNAAGKIRLSFPASTNRYYQLVYSTNLSSPAIVSNLGWGVPGMAITNSSAGRWCGAIRVRLAAP